MPKPVEAEKLKSADRPGSADDDFSAFIAGFESLPNSLRGKLIADFGSMENVLKIPGNREKIEVALKPWEDELGRVPVFLAHFAHSSALHLANVEWWEKLAKSNRKQYRRHLEALLRAYKFALDTACGIEAHRPANQQRNSIVLDIKRSKPKLSFGQVAVEYKRRTGKAMDAKQAERIFKRGNTQPDPFRLPMSSLHALKRLRPFVKFHITEEPSSARKTTKARVPSVAKSSAT